MVAILASSLVARIFEDFLVRGDLRFFQGMAGWYSTIALLGLVHAHHIPALSYETKEPIRVLRVGLKHLAERWPSSKMFQNGIDRLMESLKIDDSVGNSPAALRNGSTAAESTQDLRNLTDFPQDHGGCQGTNIWTADVIQQSLEYFPGSSENTTALFGVMMRLQEPINLPDYPDDLDNLLYDFLDNNLDPLNFSFP